MRALAVGLCFSLCLTASATTEDEIYARGAAEQVQEALRQKGPLPWKKDGLAVPTAEVAKAIHSAVAGAAYGKAHVESQRPFRAVRSGEYWVVFGSLPPGFLGGTAVTVIRASDGRIMRVIHEQ